MSIEIEPGRELDRAVAEAIGAEWRESWKADDGCWKMAAWYFADGSPAWHRLPSFSTDLNAAFTAADKVGLFPVDGMRFLRRETDGLWAVVEIYTNTPYEAYVIGQARTPALAICAAILKLKEPSNVS